VPKNVYASRYYSSFSSQSQKDEKESFLDKDRNRDADNEANISSLLQETNYLLAAVGIASKKITSYDELCRVSSSLFVAVFETLFNCRIEGINRNPHFPIDYERNAQLVVDSLSDPIQMDLKHITGKSIVSGEFGALSDLVHILVGIVSITSQETVSSIETTESFREKEAELGGYRVPHGPLSSSFARDLSLGPSSSYSISTHSSAFNTAESSSSADPPSPGPGLRLSLPQHPYRTPPASPEPLTRSLSLSSPSKLQAAQMRRERILLVAQIRKREESRRRQLLSGRALGEQWAQERAREMRAHLMRRGSQEASLLRQTHRGVLAQLRQLRIDEDAEEKLRQRVRREQLDWQAQALEQLLRDKAAMLRDQQEALRRTQRDRGRDDLRLASEMARHLKERSGRLLQRERDRLEQMRAHELVRRHELHRMLGGCWEDSLRCHPPSSLLLSWDSPLPARSRSRRRSRSMT